VKISSIVQLPWKAKIKEKEKEVKITMSIVFISNNRIYPKVSRKFTFLILIELAATTNAVVI
jgi:hypothetical protein